MYTKQSPTRQPTNSYLSCVTEVTDRLRKNLKKKNVQVRFNTVTKMEQMLSLLCQDYETKTFMN